MAWNYLMDSNFYHHIIIESVSLVVGSQLPRFNFEAALQLNYFNVDLLILLGDTSHVLQPFDL